MKSKRHPSSGGIPLQKKHGQFFLRDQNIVNTMLAEFDLKNVSVFEIGCGDGFLTRSELTQPIKQLHVLKLTQYGQSVFKKLTLILG